MDNQQKVKYKIIRTQDSGWFSVNIDFSQLEAELNRLGQQGWDLVTSVDVEGSQGRTKEIGLVLKKYV